MRTRLLHLELLFLIVAAASLVSLSCSRLMAQKSNIERASPNNTYRVKVEFRTEAPKGTRDHTERLKIQLFKDQTVIESLEAENSDQYEYSLRKGIEVVEWVGDNILRIGENSSDQPFYDELIVLNNLDENLRRVGVSYGRFESFRILDLRPGSKVILRASPGFKQDGSSKYFLGYGGITQSGKRFEGVMESKQRKSPGDGPLKFQITINTSK
jgi:hypothetical protein